jgi:hypothetical protein
MVCDACSNNTKNASCLGHASAHFMEPLKLPAARRANVTANEIKAMLLQSVTMLRKLIMNDYIDE